MNHPFFPDASFAWIFFGGVVTVTLIASYTDLRWLVVPKWLTLPAALLGLVMNAVRGGWLASEGQSVWLQESPSVLMGVVEGVLFSLGGFTVGLGLFFVVWMLGIARGGDAKLFAAVSAWVGPYRLLWLLAGSSVVMVLFAVLRTILIMLFHGAPSAIREATTKVKDPAKSKQPLQRLTTYSLPLAIATFLLLLWFYRHDLQIAKPMTGEPVPKTQRSAQS